MCNIFISEQEKAATTTTATRKKKKNQTKLWLDSYKFEEPHTEATTACQSINYMHFMQVKMESYKYRPMKARTKYEEKDKTTTTAEA